MAKRGDYSNESGEFDIDYALADIITEVNGMPDGRYIVRMVGAMFVSSRRLNKKLFKFNMVIDDRDCQFDKSPASWELWIKNGDELSKKIAMDKLKAFNALLGIDIAPGSWRNQKALDMYKGYVLSARKRTKQGGTVTFINWYFDAMIVNPHLAKRVKKPPTEKELLEMERENTDGPYEEEIE